MPDHYYYIFKSELCDRPLNHDSGCMGSGVDPITGTECLKCGGSGRIITEVKVELASTRSGIGFVLADDDA